MSLLFNVLYAAHARGTHHKLALDALAAIDAPEAERWRRLFLKHAEAYMAGAKAPDDVFKDFKNHVLHPRDGYWGGAPATARLWYEKSVDALRAQDWPGAVYAAGVLSHYVTDPVQPFHTGQSEAETCVHRAFEWSTAKAYESMVRDAAPAPTIAAPQREDWLEEMLRAAALRSNAHYEKCLAHYDINTGVVDPPAGLDAVSRRIIGELIRYAAALFARVLSRAIGEAGVAPPEVSLTLETVLATVKVPVKVLTNRMADRAEREQVLRMYDELKATGTVEENLPEDDRAVRDLHAAEVAGAARSPAPSAAAEAEPPREVPRQAPAAAPRLALGDDVVDAPCIGPTTAKRLGALGIKTVADFLQSDASATAKRLGLGYITPSEIESWQIATRLVLAVPGLSGTGAQLLVGAGYREPSAIAAADAARIEADVRAFALTPAGRRVLRDATPPPRKVIETWAESTRRALAA